MTAKRILIVEDEKAIRDMVAFGLRRAGFSGADRLELKRLYHALFRSGKKFRAAVAQAQTEFTSAGAKTLLDFVATTKRGICTDSGKRTGPED